MKLSKSKLALAKVINENGGWPQDSEWVVQNGEHGRISFSINKPVRHDSKSWMAKGGFNFKIEVCKPLKNWYQNVLSREEYYQAYPKSDADGWIEWGGGECPVCIDDVVDVMQLDGHTYTARAVNFHWLLKSGSVSVAAYRLHKPEAKPEFCESVTRSIPEPEIEDAESRLAKALELVKAAAPHLLSDKYKFDGDEVMGERKPTIEQLAQDYRNAKDYAERLQEEADDAKAASDAALGELERAGEALGLLIGIAKPDRGQELVITNWRDLRVRDVIEITGSSNDCWKDHSGREMTVKDVYPEHGDNDSQAYLIGESGDWWLGGNTTWRFIRRP